jgi:hypothetical protein
MMQWEALKGATPILRPRIDRERPGDRDGGPYSTPDLSPTKLRTKEETSLNDDTIGLYTFRQLFSLSATG